MQSTPAAAAAAGVGAAAARATVPPPLLPPPPPHLNLQLRVNNKGRSAGMQPQTKKPAAAAASGRPATQAAPALAAATAAVASSSMPPLPPRAQATAAAAAGARVSGGSGASLQRRPGHSSSSSQAAPKPPLQPQPTMSQSAHVPVASAAAAPSVTAARAAASSSSSSLSSSSSASGARVALPRAASPLPPAPSRLATRTGVSAGAHHVPQAALAPKPLPPSAAAIDRLCASSSRSPKPTFLMDSPPLPRAASSSSSTSFARRQSQQPQAAAGATPSLSQQSVCSSTPSTSPLPVLAPKKQFESTEASAAAAAARAKSRPHPPKRIIKHVCKNPASCAAHGCTCVRKRNSSSSSSSGGSSSSSGGSSASSSSASSSAKPRNKVSWAPSTQLLDAALFTRVDTSPSPWNFDKEARSQKKREWRKEQKALDAGNKVDEAGTAKINDESQGDPEGSSDNESGSNEFAALDAEMARRIQTARRNMQRLESLSFRNPERKAAVDQAKQQPPKADEGEEEEQEEAESEASDSSHGSDRMSDVDEDSSFKSNNGDSTLTFSPPPNATAAVASAVVPVALAAAATTSATAVPPLQPRILLASPRQSSRTPIIIDDEQKAPVPTRGDRNESRKEKPREEPQSQQPQPPAPPRAQQQRRHELSHESLPPQQQQQQQPQQRRESQQPQSLSPLPAPHRLEAQRLSHFSASTRSERKPTRVAMLSRMRQTEQATPSSLIGSGRLTTPLTSRGSSSNHRERSREPAAAAAAARPATAAKQPARSSTHHQQFSGLKRVDEVEMEASRKRRHSTLSSRLDEETDGQRSAAAAFADPRKRVKRESNINTVLPLTTSDRAAAASKAERDKAKRAAAEAAAEKEKSDRAAAEAAAQEKVRRDVAVATAAAAAAAAAQAQAAVAAAAAVVPAPPPVLVPQAPVQAPMPAPFVPQVRVEPSSYPPLNRSAAVLDLRTPAAMAPAPAPAPLPAAPQPLPAPSPAVAVTSASARPPSPTSPEQSYRPFVECAMEKGTKIYRCRICKSPFSARWWHRHMQNHFKAAHPDIYLSIHPSEVFKMPAVKLEVPLPSPPQLQSSLLPQQQPHPIQPRPLQQPKQSQPPMASPFQQFSANRSAYSQWWNQLQGQPQPQQLQQQQPPYPPAFDPRLNSAPPVTMHSMPSAFPGAPLRRIQTASAFRPPVPHAQAHGSSHAASVPPTVRMPQPYSYTAPQLAAHGVEVTTHPAMPGSVRVSAQPQPLAGHAFMPPAAAAAAAAGPAAAARSSVLQLSLNREEWFNQAGSSYRCKQCRMVIMFEEELERHIGAHIKPPTMTPSRDATTVEAQSRMPQ